MALRVVGAGLGRTGTHSLKLALEQLLGAPCYHMLEVLSHPEYVQYWRDAVGGKAVDWSVLMNGYSACVDWPAAAYWEEIAAVNPDAIVLLSTRSSTDAWYKSAHDTIFDISARDLPPDPNMAEIAKMPKEMLAKKFTPDWRDADAAKK